MEAVPAGPSTPTPAGPSHHVAGGPSHAGPPNDMVTTMLLACPDGLAHAGRSPFAIPA